MKKILAILAIFMICKASSIYAVDEFLDNQPAGTDNISLIDDYCQDNNLALERSLIDLRTGCEIVYASASTLIVNLGKVICGNSGGTVLKMRKNTSNTTVTWSDLDTGSEANSTTYYVYANGDADASTFTVKLSTDSSSPSGVTYYRQLGSFYNNSSGNIERIDNDDLSMWEIDGTERQLKQADEIDMRSKKIINLATPTDDTDASTKAYVDDVGAATGLWEVDGSEHQLTTADEIDMQSKQIKNVTDPTSAQDAATKNYVDTITIGSGDLNTSTGSASGTVGTNSTSAIAMNTYCFFPNFYLSSPGWSAAATQCAQTGYSSSVADQTARTGFTNESASSFTYAVRWRYITASGQDYWIYVLQDKNTQEIEQVWCQADASHYGTHKSFSEIPHPFGSDIDLSKKRIILVEKENTAQLYQEAQEKSIDVASLVFGNYTIDTSQVCEFSPLHSGEFLGKKPVLITDIPDFIKVRKLRPYADNEKLERENKREAEREAFDTEQKDKEKKKKSIRTKLKQTGLTEDEIAIILERR